MDMTSPVRTKQKFETFVMTGDTIIKTGSISPELRTSQESFNYAYSKECVMTSRKDTISKETDTRCNNTNRNTDTNFKTLKNLSCCKLQRVCSSKSSELDIPPDDISSEDELYKEALLDVDHLPPPPDDFLTDHSHGHIPSEDKKDVVAQSNLADEPFGYGPLNRRRSYESITAEGKNHESEKVPSSHNTPDGVDHIKVCVRNYKSHDNYLQLEQSVEFVPIVFDEAGAISIDALNYNKIEFPHLKLNPDYSLNEPQGCRSNSGMALVGANTIKNAVYDKSSEHSSKYESEDSPNTNTEGLSTDPSFPNNSLSRKDADLPSAQRLAKRLFALDGFQQIDVAKHLGKKDSFSVLVGKEYLKHFDFEDQKLDVALRSFLGGLMLVGETQERERVLAHFSHRYVECNKNFPLSQDSCHTVICAMMLLNIDHHSQNVTRKMTLDEFIENLSALNDGKDFPENLLKEVYLSVCNEPFKCPLDGAGQMSENVGASVAIGKNPFLSVPDTNNALEYKRGYVMRKCCIDPDGHKTSLGKRRWRMFHATLRGLVLYLHKDEHGMKRNGSGEYHDHHNAIRIHHALAEKASDYIKKQHVFRLTTCDSAQYLFQTSDNAECQSWVNCINFVAASLSSAPLPSAVGSQRKFQRPLMPSSCTKLDATEQLKKLKDCLETLEWELEEHRGHPPEKGTKSRMISDFLDKEGFLTFEIKRFKKYCNLLEPHCQNIIEHHHSPPPPLPPDLNPGTGILQDVIEESNTILQEGLTSSENFKRCHSDRPAIKSAYPPS